MQDFIPNQRRADVSIRPLDEQTPPTLFFFNGSPEHIIELRKIMQEIAADHRLDQILVGIKTPSRSTHMIIQLVMVDEFGPMYRMNDTWYCKLMKGPQPAIPGDGV